MEMLMRDVSRLIFILIIRLNQVTERKRLDGGDLSISTGGSEEVPLLGRLGVALQIDLFASLARGLLGGLVRLHALDDLLLALRGTDVLDAHVDALLEDASVDELVHADSDGGLGHVEDDAGASVVVLVGHALVDGGVGEDVDVVANLHGEKVLGEVGHTMLAKFLREHVARARSGSE